MCGGGGDGGAEARRQQEEARVARAIKQLNRTFGVGDPNKTAERERLYGTVRTDAVNKAMSDLDRDKVDNSRELNFMLARQGLAGGSADIDSNKRLIDRYQEGVLQASNMGDTVANTARTNDEKTRVNLINNIRAGLDGGTATQIAYQGLQDNIRNAQAEANALNLQGFFGPLMQGLQGAQYQTAYDDVIRRQKQKSGYGSATDSYDGTVR